jgi:hypothetical protein
MNRVKDIYIHTASSKPMLDMEPFDEALDRRVWSLAATRMQWQKRLAETRQKLPKELELSMQELVQEQRILDNDNTPQSDEGDEDVIDEATCTFLYIYGVSVIDPASSPTNPLPRDSKYIPTDYGFG